MTPPTPIASAIMRRRFSLAVLILGLCGFLLLVGTSSRVTARLQPAREEGGREGQEPDYSNFSHSSPRHSSVECAACHRRADNSPQPSLPGHSACTGCHLAQFVTPAIPMCAICHTDLESPRPPVKAFPQTFKEGFNMKFDHAQHNSGSARPDKGCLFCHSSAARRGVKLSIPAGLSAHNQCYVCHTMEARSGGRDIGLCSTCHSLAQYSRTSTNARAFRAFFSHADHGARQRLGCADCHTPRAGLPQSRQVSAPLTAEHFGTGRGQSCMSCHNGRRAFGDTSFSDCKRCHKAPSFRM